MNPLFITGDASGPTPAAHWRMLALVCIALVLSMTTWFSATAVTAQLAAAFAMGSAATAWLTSAVQIGFVAGALGLTLSGLADRVSPRPLMLFSALMATGANLAMLGASTSGGIFLARGLTGVALAGIYPPALKLVATWFRRSRGLAMGMAIAALTLGSALPHLLRAIGVGLPWRYVVGGASLLSLAGAGMIAGFVREGPYRFSRPGFSLARIAPVLRDRKLLLINIGYFGHMWELYAMWAWFLPFASRAPALRALPLPAAPSLVTFMVVASGVIGCLLGGILADRFGRTATTAGMMFVSGGCAFVIGFLFAGPLWPFLLMAILWGISVIGDSAQFSALVTEIGDGRFVGTALALQLGLGFSLTVVSIQLLPRVADLLGWQWIFLPLVPGPLCGAMAMLRLKSFEWSRRL